MSIHSPVMKKRSKAVRTIEQPGLAGYFESTTINPDGIPKWNASLSTMWAFQNFPVLDGFFLAARRLGFASIELNHQVDSNMLAGIDLRRYQFSSIHEPCPTDVPDAELKAHDWLISSLDDEKRIQGVRVMMRTVDLARELGIKEVIVHSGNVNMSSAPENALRQLFIQGEIGSPQAEELRYQILAERAAHAPAHLDAVRRSLAKLVEFSGRAGVRLGLENRYHINNIPSPDELAWLLDGFDSAQIGFWYDAGHAQTLDRLGIFPHEGWLQRFNDRVSGAHFHDVRGIDDHYAPGLGEVDWSMPSRYLPKGIVRTLELRPSNTPPDVLSGISRLVEAGLIDPLG